MEINKTYKVIGWKFFHLFNCWKEGNMNINIYQKPILRKGITFEFVNENLMKVYRKGFLFIDEKYVNLSHLNPEPLKKKNGFKHFIYAGLIPAIATVILILCLVYFKAITSEDVIGIGCIIFFITFILTLLFVAKGINSSYDLVIFSDKETGREVLSLWNNLPDKKSFDLFIENLKNKIISSKNNSLYNFPDLIRNIHKLKQEGILTEKQYENILEYNFEYLTGESIIGFKYENASLI